MQTIGRCANAIKQALTCLVAEGSAVSRSGWPIMGPDQHDRPHAHLRAISHCVDQSPVFDITFHGGLECAGCRPLRIPSCNQHICAVLRDTKPVSVLARAICLVCQSVVKPEKQPYTEALCNLRWQAKGELGMAKLVEASRDERTTILTLSAPHRRNAISVEMRTELLAALKEAHRDSNTRAIILTGTGEHFCAGGDLSAAHASAPDPARTETNVRILQDIVRLITGPKPVLAAVEGAAFGAGMSLAVACDFVFAGKSARFAASFAKVGLCADAGLTWLLPQRVGLARSRRLMISGDVVGSAEALAIGLADELTADGETLTVARGRARRICEMAPLSIEAVKAALGNQPSSFEAALDLELQSQVRLVSTADYIEGRTAFIEKRVAAFRGV